jgi:hypothetical protein
MQPQKKISSRTTAAATRKEEPSNAKAGQKKKAAGAGDIASRASITEKERRSLIAQAAYLAAARRSFQGGSAEKDWLEAEAEIDARLLRCEQSSNN